MSRRAVPFLVAGVTGVLSGIYIFKPLFDQSDQSAQDVVRDLPAGGAPASDAGRSAAASSAQGSTNPEASKSSSGASTSGKTARQDSQK
ncbi:hypothetical protein V8D89_015000 [Ganoderma adspersum]